MTEEVLCGPRCLWLVAHLRGVDVSLETLVKTAATDPRAGTTVANMVRTLVSLGIPAEAIRTNLKDLNADGRLAILMVNENSHYVLFERADSAGVHIVDAAERRRMTYAEFQNWWGGIAIMAGETRNSGNSIGRVLWYSVWGAPAFIASAVVAMVLCGKARRARPKRDQSS